ncbi:MAG: 50S ribosomal protein L25/general stress protein Ctc [Prevotellaceae bacterium]|jgi:large subunit ribosomal protein L25|nr:50S ribosomal protein L25/general stress protein Ctc [Prevotellaceae bacterium]
MKTIDLKGSSRAALGKDSTAKLRKSGSVPCVIYGNGDNISFAVEETALHPLVYTPSAYLVSIDIDGKKELAVMRELQFHPVSDAILHVDFYRIDHSKPITIDVPVALQGSPEGVKLGGKLQQLTRKVKVSALSQNLPDVLNVDISALGLGKSIFVADLSFENITILTPKSAVVCAVKMTRAAIGAAAAASASTAAPAATAAAPAAKKK